MASNGITISNQLFLFGQILEPRRTIRIYSVTMRLMKNEPIIQLLSLKRLYRHYAKKLALKTKQKTVTTVNRDHCE